MSKFCCATCHADLTRLPEGEWIDAQGYIFCPVTDEIHYRTLKQKSAA